MTSRRFPAPWQVEQTPGGYKVLDANGQALAYVYARETKQQADIAQALTFDEAQRIAVNVAKLSVCCRRLILLKAIQSFLVHSGLQNVTGN